MTSPTMFNRLISSLIICSAFLLTAVTVSATEVMKRPLLYKETPNRFAVETDPETHVIHRRAMGKVSIGYFGNWGIYGANFQPTDIVPKHLTHILYSFADINPSTGAITLTDLYADEQKRFPTDTSEPGNNLYGCLKQLYLMKLKQRNLKVLLSVGGWTYSQSGHFSFITSASSRATFVASAVKLIEDYGLDGIDIDFEFPATPEQGSGLAALMTSLRTAFDNLAAKKGDSNTYQLTAAVGAAAANHAHLVVPQMNAALTFWNLMAYDYSGSWLTYTDNQANVYGGARTGVSTDSALKFYFGAGAMASKFVLGIPLYGRAFENTAGLGQSYNGVGPGTTSAGIYSYKVLPLAGAKVFENTTDISSYSYDARKRELVSYDTPDIVKLKVRYLSSKGLAGSMFWELSTDKIGSQSLVAVSANNLGSLDQTQNHINFPNSKWDNIRNNMGQGKGKPSPPHVSPASTAPSKPAATPNKPATTTTNKPATTAPSSGSCSGVAAWTSGIAYVGGQSVTYGGHLWTAKWWSQADTPGGAAGVWTDKGAC